MSHGEDDDEPQLKSLRAVWLSMPDEDPPERGLDALMAAARAKATEMTAAPSVGDEPEPSWWQRFLAGLRRPPVLALATVVVLVAGAVLVGNRHTKLDSTAPSGGARPSSEDVRMQDHTHERSHETAPPPPAMPARERQLDREESHRAVGGAQQLAAPREDEARGADVGEPDQVTSGSTATTSTATRATATTKTATTTRPPGSGEATADTAAVSCSTVRAKLQTLQAAEARAYRSKIARDPALAKCLEPAAEATTAAPAD